MNQALRDKLIRNIDDVEWRAENAHSSLYEGVRSASLVGRRVPSTVAKKLGASVDWVPPGKATCPYHFHYAQEEMFVILEGSGTLRVADERIPVRQGDVIGIPAGPEYPHQLINTSNEPLKYLSISTQEFPEVCEYPDSGKYLAFTPVAGPLLAKGRMHRPDTDLDYWDGEP